MDFICKYYRLTDPQKAAEYHLYSRLAGQPVPRPEDYSLACMFSLKADNPEAALSQLSEYLTKPESPYYQGNLLAVGDLAILRSSGEYFAYLSMPFSWLPVELVDYLL